MTKKFPLWINNCHIFAHFVQFWPCYFFSMPFYGRQPTWHEKLVKICGIANFLNFNLAKSNFWLVAICPIKRHLDYLFRMEEVHVTPSTPFHLDWPGLCASDKGVSYLETDGTDVLAVIFLERVQLVQPLKKEMVKLVFDFSLCIASSLHSGFFYKNIKIF